MLFSKCYIVLSTLCSVFARLINKTLKFYDHFKVFSCKENTFIQVAVQVGFVWKFNYLNKSYNLSFPVLIFSKILK